MHREVLFLKYDLRDYGDYLRDFDKAKYLMNANDELIIQNYRPVFTSRLSSNLRKPPVFQSTDNADFYDTMMADGALIHLGSFFLNPKTTSTEDAIFKSK